MNELRWGLFPSFHHRKEGNAPDSKFVHAFLDCRYSSRVIVDRCMGLCGSRPVAEELIEFGKGNGLVKTAEAAFLRNQLGRAYKTGPRSARE